MKDLTKGEIVLWIIGLFNLLLMLFMFMDVITPRTFVWFVISQIIILLYVFIVKYFKENE